MSRRTRGHARRDHTQCEKQFRMGFIIGKSDDEYVNGQYGPQDEDEDEVQQSDAAVASYIRRVCQPTPIGAPM